MQNQAEIPAADIRRAVEQIPIPDLPPQFFYRAAPELSAQPTYAVRRRLSPPRRVWISVAAAAGIVIASAVVVNLPGQPSRSHSRLPQAIASGEQCCRPGESQLQWYRAYLQVHPATARLVRARQLAAEKASSRVTRKSTGIRSLVAYIRPARTSSFASLPASVSELVANQETFLTGGQTPVSIQEPIIGDSDGGPSVYVVTYPSNMCVITALKGATASCYVALREGGGLLSTSYSVVDGKRFIDGLVGNDVSSVQVSAADTSAGSTTQAVISNNAFIARLPYRGGHLGAVTLTVRRSGGGATATITLPGNRTFRQP